jgi:hypothetical protein
MTDRHPVTSDAVSTLGLILHVVAVVSFALCMAAWGLGEGPIIIGAGIGALVSFVASLVIVVIDSNRSFDDPVAQLRIDARVIQQV